MLMMSNKFLWHQTFYHHESAHDAGDGHQGHPLVMHIVWHTTVVGGGCASRRIEHANDRNSPV